MADQRRPPPPGPTPPSVTAPMPVEPLLPPPPAVDDAIRVAAAPRRAAVARMVQTIGCLASLGIGVLASPTLAPAEPLPGPALTAPEPRPRSAIVPLPADPGSGPVVLDLPYEGFGADDFDGAVAPGGSPSCGTDCVVPGSGFPDCFDDLWAARPWYWQLMPNNLIYTSYLAGPKEPRIGSSVYDDTEPALVGGGREGWLWDTTLGGRASILRYGSDTVVHPQGFEVQIEGAAFVRLDPEDERDLRSADYRFGVPVVYGVGRWQTKFAYYHNSAHLGDEFMLKHPTYPRINYVRDCLVWGNSWYPLDWLRLYGEVGWAFYNAGGSEPWELQGGCELIQARPTGGRGAPFLAVNGMSRQELDWGGNVCVQAGWAWRGRRSEKLYRVGFEYLYGSDPQYEFVYNNQNRCGFGMWYDF